MIKDDGDLTDNSEKVTRHMTHDTAGANVYLTALRFTLYML